MHNLITLSHAERARVAVCATLLGVMSLTCSARVNARPNTHSVDAPVTIQRVLKAGDANYYKLTFHGTPPTGGTSAVGAFTLTVSFKETVSDIKTDGTATLTDRILIGSISAKAQDIDLKELQPELPFFVKTLDKGGRLTGVTAVGVQNPFMAQACDFVKGLMLTESLFYPTRPVSVGEQWKPEPRSGAPVEADVKREASATFVSKEPVGGVNTAKIKASMVKTTGGTSPGKQQFDGTANIDLKDGSILKVVGVLALNSDIIAKGDFTLSRYEPDSKADAAPTAPADKKP